MPLFKTYHGILIQKRRKDFEDGGGGWYCTIVLKDQNLIRFWCKDEDGDDIGEEAEVEEWTEYQARDFRIQIREWDGRTKLTYCPR